MEIIIFFYLFTGKIFDFLFMKQNYTHIFINFDTHNYM